MQTFDYLQPQTRPTAVALGMFDGVHLGHRAVIQKAVQSGLVSVVFTFDVSAGRPTGKATAKDIFTMTERLRRLEQLGVDQVLMPPFVAIQALTAEEFFQQILVGILQAKQLFCGADYRFGKGAVGDVSLLQRLCDGQDIRLTVVDAVCVADQPVSSTRIRNHLLQGEIQMANRLLGSPYSVTEPVIYGKQIGRTIECPTVNQLFDDSLLQPRYGVYVAAVYMDGKRYGGVANLGIKPTVMGTTPLLETHILGVEGDFYGKVLTVELLDFLRAEEKFDGINALRDAIHRNIQSTKTFFEKEREDELL